MGIGLYMNFIRKIMYVVLLIFTITVGACSNYNAEDDNEHADNDKTIKTNTSETKINNIAGVKITNLSKPPYNIKNARVYNNDGTCYILNHDLRILEFDADKTEVIRTAGDISVINQTQLSNNYQITDFIFYKDVMRVEITLSNNNNGGIKKLLIDAENNKFINIKPLLNTENNDYDIAGSFDNGNKAVVLSYEHNITWSGLYVWDIDSGNITNLIKDATILYYTISHKHNQLLFYGNKDDILTKEFYDYTTRGNFFLYYPFTKEPATWLYSVDLLKGDIKKIPDSDSYHYSWIVNDSVIIEDAEGERFVINKNTGVKTSTIPDFKYNMIDKYMDSAFKMIHNDYAIETLRYTSPVREKLYRIDTKTGMRTLILVINRYVGYIYITPSGQVIFNVFFDDTIDTKETFLLSF